MHGVRRKNRDGKPPQRFYQRDNAPLKRNYDPNCPHPAIRIDRLENFVLEVLREHVLEANAADRVKDAIVRAKARKAKQVPADEKRLRAVRQKIERGTENLALADREDFAGISKLLMKWREEEAELVDRIDRRNSELEPLPEAMDVIAQFGDLRKRLKHADRIKLAHAVKQTVASITIGTRTAKTDEITHPEHFGELRLHEALCTSRLPSPIRRSARARYGASSASWFATPANRCTSRTSPSTWRRPTSRMPPTTFAAPRRHARSVRLAIEAVG